MKPSVLMLATMLAAPFAVPPALAGDPPADKDAKIKALEEQIQTLSDQVHDLKRSTSDQYADTQNQQASAVKVTIVGGRPSISSADGDFTAVIRALVQFDSGYYAQSAAAKALPSAYGPDLSSGSNFRRANLGIQGKLFGDWSYNFTYDFAGSGTEAAGHIQSVYLQYDGLAPWAFRAGAFPPPASLEDGTSSSDTLFLERNAPANLQRSIAGGDGRDAVTIQYAGSELFAALSFTGGKVQDSAVFDEQQALLGRVSDLIWSDADFKLLLGANGAYVFKLPDTVANGGSVLETTAGATALHSLTLSDYPELTVDSTASKLVTTGALAANHYAQWGLEAAGSYQNIYAQAGYFAYYVDRAAVSYKTYTSASTTATTQVRPDDNSFSGWYVQASWILTGETRGYKAENGAFSAPKPAKPFSLKDGGWGAWEIAARFSDLNLNDNTGDDASVITGWTATSTKTYTFYNTVRGGKQKIVSLGLNWYPNSSVRVLLDYQWIDINRLQTPGTVATTATPALPASAASQKINAFALRVQFAL
jgi:phosphate-selective porin OprO/OprP